jgi:hypothetical protein
MVNVPLMHTTIDKKHVPYRKEKELRSKESLASDLGLE